MTSVEKIIKDNTLTFEQKVIALARESENSVDVLNISDKTQELRDKGIICDLFEGNAPYRPRYILPDYEKFMKNGSEFLKLTPACDIWDAVNNLLILYKHVPSITTMPVYIGNIDELLEPYIDDIDEATKAIKFFLMHIDRTITDSFCHSNIGPKDTKAGRIILKLEGELQNANPNITLKYSKDTPKDFVLEAIKVSLDTAKPSFAHHEMFVNEFGLKYAIASCYNGLLIGGGAYTLVRLNLAKLVDTACGIDDFFDDKLPNAISHTIDYIDERIRYVVKESNFFESNFLAKEGLIDIEKFTAMFGIVGLAECVNTLLDAKKQSDRYGHSEVSNELGLRIVKYIYDSLEKHTSKYCIGTDKKILLHAQVGLGEDIGVSPGCRIPIGEEPELWDHLKQSAKFHKYFPSGIGDIFVFEKNASNNLDYILNVIDGSFKEGMRYFSLYSSDADVIRITGFLVKKSEIEKLDNSQAVLHDTVVLGMGQVKNSNIYSRKIR